MIVDKSKIKKIYTGRIDMEKDLLDAITEFININNIQKGYISIIGALSEVTIGYYDQTKKVYKKKKLKKIMEIVSATGNISINEGKNFPHIHIILADKTLNTFGGHLFTGSKVFAAEFTIIELKGKPLIRKFDPVTRLNLWQ